MSQVTARYTRYTGYTSSHLSQVTRSMCTCHHVIVRCREEVTRCRQVELKQGSSWRRGRTPWQQVGEDEREKSLRRHLGGGEDHLRALGSLWIQSSLLI